MKLHTLRNHTLVAAAGSLLFAFAASANDDPMTMDTNKDGMISASEHAAGIKSEWSRLDATGTGTVSAMSVDSMHRDLDADKDGKITSSEYESGSRSRFSKWDTNGDGNLSADEIKAGNKPMTDQPR